MVAVAVCFLFYIIGSADWPENYRKPIVHVFLLATAALYTWMGYINVVTHQDISVFALGTTFIATVYSVTGPIRPLIYVASAASVAATIALNISAEFVPGLLTNLAAVMGVAVLLDRYTLTQNLRLYEERRRVEVERARADAVLYNVLPVSVADELKKSKSVNAQKYENMTVMFADIVGFTSFASQVPPDALVLVLNRIFSLFDGIVEDYGLEKIKTIGDAYMVVSYDDPTKVADLSLKFLAAIGKYNDENNVNFNLRIGIHTGPAVAGVIGLKRFLYDVWGDTVNTASRMESTGVPGRIQVTDVVKQRLAKTHAFEERGVMPIKGKGELLTHFLVSSRKDELRMPANG